MNKIYRIIWNNTLKAWVVVAEIAKACGKASSRTVVTSVMTTSLTVLPAVALAQNTLEQKLQILPNENIDQGHCLEVDDRGNQSINPYCNSSNVNLSDSVLLPVSARNGVILRDGASSIKLGNDANPAGSFSIAIGSHNANNSKPTTALGVNSIAVGVSAVAHGRNSIALGNHAESGTVLGTSTTGPDGKIDDGLNAVAIGTNTNAVHKDSVALGGYSVADRAKYKIGYGAPAGIPNPLELGRDATTEDPEGDIVTGDNPIDQNNSPDRVNSTWQSTAAAVSVGNKANNLTRQIINVAAGSEDTDAVNVAQLKQVANAAVHYVSINDGGTSGGNHQNNGAQSANSIAIGVGASAQGIPSPGVDESGNPVTLLNPALAIGANAKASKGNALAIGTSAQASGTGSIAYGYQAQALDGDDSLAIGSSSKVTSSNGIAIGTGAQALATTTSSTTEDGTANIAIGLNALATEIDSVALGVGAHAFGNQSIALGLNAQATKLNSTALGTGAQAFGDNSIVLGPNSQAESDAQDGISIGNSNIINGESAIAVGARNRLNGKNNVVVGSDNNASNITNTYILGNDVTGTQSNSVILGAHSQDRAATTEKEIVYHDFGDGHVHGFAGAGSVAAGVVSVGSEGKERQLINLAAGKIGKQSTDAINGSQLFAVNEGIQSLLAAAMGSGSSVTPDKNNPDQLNWVPPTFNVNGDYSFNTVGDAIEAAAAGTVVNSNSSNITVSPTQAGGKNIYTVALSDNLQLNSIQLGDDATGKTTLQHNGITITPSNGTGTVQLTDTGLNNGGNTITGVGAGSITNGSTDAINGDQLWNMGNSVATALGGGAGLASDGTISKPTYNVGGILHDNVGSALEALDKQEVHYVSINSPTDQAGNYNNDGAKQTDSIAIGVNAQADVEGGIALGTGSIANTAAGKIGYGAEGQTSPTWQATSGAVSVGNSDTSNNITRQITNVAAGAEDTDAVNVAQLKQIETNANTAIKAAATEVEAGVNTSVSSRTGGNGQQIYAVDLNKDLRLGDGSSGFGSVTIGNTKLSENGIEITASNSANNVILNGSGLNNGNNKITNVAAGTESTDAVNLAQMNQVKTDTNNAINSIASSLGGGASYDGNNGWHGPNYTVNGKPQTTVGDAIKAAVTTVTNSDNNITINPTQDTDGHMNYAVGLKKDLILGDDQSGFGSVTIDKTKLSENGIEITASNSANNVILNGSGLNNGNNKITNVAVGEISTTSTDAINGSQLWNTGNSVAAALGGGAGLASDGKITKPTYNVAGDKYYNVGDALLALDQRENKKEMHYVSINYTVPGDNDNYKNDGATSTNSIAIGVGAKATAATGSASQSALAIGTKANANGAFAIAIGNNTSARSSSIALGADSRALGSGSFSAGGANAVTDNTIAIGSGAIAGGIDSETSDKYNYAIALGFGAIANGEGAIAMGSNAKASQKDSISIGRDSMASGRYSLALGNSATTNGVIGGVALGRESSVHAAAGQDGYSILGGKKDKNGNITISNSEKWKWVSTSGSVAIGDAITINEDGSRLTRQITGLSAGTQDTDAVNVAQLKEAKTHTDNLASSIATALGAQYKPDSNEWTAPSYNVGGEESLHDVGSALAALDKQGPHYISINRPADEKGNYNNDGAKQTDSIAIGVNAEANVEGGIALGTGSVASTAAGEIGYGAEGKTSSTWKATSGAVSVGDASKNITRQITNVAAGTADTDAVNVAQLRPIKTNIDSANNAISGIATSLGGNAKYENNVWTGPSYTVNNNEYRTVENAIKAAATEVEAGVNTSVSTGVGSNGQHIYTVSLDKNLMLGDDKGAGSVTVGNTKLDTDGIVITANNPANNVALNSNGLNNGGNKITGVGKGTEDTDAVNVAQLNQIETNANNAIKAAATEVEAGVNTSVSSRRGDNGQQIYAVNLKKDLILGDVENPGSVIVGNTKLDTDGIVITANDPAKNVALNNNGLNNGGNTITGVGAGTNDTDAVNMAQLNQIETNANNAIKAAATEVEAGVNTSVSARTGDNGQQIYTVSLDKDLILGQDNDFGSVTIGNTKLSESGLNNGNNKITNVAAGAISATSTDAINGSQLWNTGSTVAAALGGGAELESDGTIKPPTYVVGGNNYEGVESALNALDTQIGNSKFHFVSINGGTSDDGNYKNDGAHAVNSIAIGVNAQADSVGGIALGSGSKADTAKDEVGYAKPNSNSPSVLATTEELSTWQATRGAVSVGDAVNGITRQITNVAAGTKSTDAVNVAQLKQIAKTLGEEVAGVLGGGLEYDSQTNEWKNGDKFIVNGNDYGSVENALNTLSTSGNTDKPVVYTTAEGKRVYKSGDKFYDNENHTGQSIAEESIIAYMNDAGNGLKAIQLGNVATSIIPISENSTFLQNLASAAGNSKQHAVNVGDLHNAVKGINQDLGMILGVDVNSDGSLKLPPNVGINGITNFKNAIEKLAEGWNLSANTDLANAPNTNSDTNRDGPTGPNTHVSIKPGDHVVFKQGHNIEIGMNGTQITIGTSNELTADKVTVGDVVIDKNTNKITGIQNGRVEAGSTDAVNGGQLHEAMQNAAKVKAGSSNILVTTSTDAGSTIDVNPNLNLQSVTTGNTVMNNQGISVGEGDDKVTLTDQGLNNGGHTLSNVGEGVNGTDAVNVDQLNRAVSNYDSRIKHLENKVESVENHANAGIAQALATAGLPQAYSPGKSMMAIGGGYYRGEQGYAIGYSGVSDNGNWVVKASGSGNSRGNFGGTVGVGYQW